MPERVDRTQRHAGAEAARPNRLIWRILRAARAQAGVSTAEILVVTAIAATMALMLAGVSTSLLRDTPRLLDGSLALDEVLRAQQATRVDFQRAQSTDLADGGVAPTVTITYTLVGTGAQESATYRLNGNALERVVAGGATRTVVRNVHSVQFARSGNVYSVALTASTSYPGRVGETNTWDVLQRISM